MLGSYLSLTDLNKHNHDMILPLFGMIPNYIITPLFGIILEPNHRNRMYL